MLKKNAQKYSQNVSPWSPKDPKIDPKSSKKCSKNLPKSVLKKMFKNLPKMCLPGSPKDPNIESKFSPGSSWKPLWEHLGAQRKPQVSHRGPRGPPEPKKVPKPSKNDVKNDQIAKKFTSTSRSKCCSTFPFKPTKFHKMQLRSHSTLRHGGGVAR